MNPVRALLLAGLLAVPLFHSPQTSRAAGPGEKDKERPKNGPVSYYRDVRPLFQQHCQGCHQPAKPLGSYIMTSHADLLKVGDRGLPGVVASQPDKSLVIEQIVPKEGKEGKRAAMPKGKDPLSADAIELIRTWIAQGAKDDTPKTAIDVVDEKHPPVYTLAPVVSTLDYSPDGSLLAVSGFHEVLLWKADGSQLLGRLVGLSERIQSLAFSPDGSQLAVAGGAPGRFGEVQVWDVAKKKLKYSISVTFDTVYGVSWSPDGSKIAFGCADNTLRAIEASSGKQILFQGAHSDWVLGTCFSRDGDYLVSISRDMTIKLTEVATQRFVDNITSITPGALKGGIQTVARRPLKERTIVKTTNLEVGDTRDKAYDEVLIGGSDGIPRLYRMHRTSKRVIGDDANKIRDFAGLPGRLFAAAFSSDGARVAVGSSLDGVGEVRIYQAGDGKQVARAEKLSSVYTLAYRPDGKQIAAGGFDGAVRLIDPDTGKVVKEFVPVPLAK